MIQGEKKITTELILNRIDDYNIYKHYLGFDFDLKKKYPSPFRENGIDNNPNLAFKKFNNTIIFKDFANDKSGDVFTFVSKLFNLQFIETLKKIDMDLGLGIQNKNLRLKISVIPKEFSHCSEKNLLQITELPWDIKRANYWIKDYEITISNLYKEKICYVDKLWLNKKEIPNYNNLDRFAYIYDDYLKIYTPESKTMKWLSNTPNDFISGFDDIKARIFNGLQSDRLFIAGSKKDEMVLKNFLSSDICSTQNESKQSINQKDMSIILKGYKRENIYMCYDNDKAGKEAAKYYVDNYGFNSITTPDDLIFFGVKDWGDYIKSFYYYQIKEYLNILGLINY